MQTNAAEVVRVHDLTHDVRELDLRLISPTTLDFQPGQFISFEIPIEGRPHPMTRAYSIASPPSQRSILTVVFNRVDHGPGSTFLFSLKPGDQVHFKGPAGSFRLRDDAPRNLLFVATGTGIAPLRSMLHTLLPKPPRRSYPCYGVSEPSGICTIRKSCANWRPGILCFTVPSHCLVPSRDGPVDRSRHRAGVGACQDGGQPRRVSLRKRRHD